MTLSDVQREMVRAASQAGQAAAARTVPTTLPGVIVGVDPTNTIATVQADGPNEAHGAQVVAPVTFRPGDRCMLLYMGDRAACYVIGRMSGDWEDWHVVGQAGEPPFLNAWGHSAGTVALGQNGQAQVMFTMRSGRVELRGSATRSTGGAEIFRLPEPYWPDNDLLIPCVGALTAWISIISVDQATGGVSIVGVVGPTEGGPATVAVLDGISFTARIQTG